MTDADIWAKYAELEQASKCLKTPAQLREDEQVRQEWLEV